VVTSTRRGHEPAEAADDVAELLESEVGREPALGDHVVAELERDPVLDDRVVGVRDVAEGTRVDHDRLALERLDEVRLERVLHDHRHRARDLELLGGHGLAVVGRGDHDPAQASAQVGEVGGEGEHGHDLGRGDDDELVLARDPVQLAAQADHGVPELARVDVEGPRPGDRLRVDPQGVPARSRRRAPRQQVVGRPARGSPR
jgi:hypothetical protein